jgi:1,5-anhydro-D-fructose reductase (1,5-anhydro-D-mannitol-forming)
VSDIGWGFVGASTWARRWMIPAVRATTRGAAVAVCSTSRERGDSVVRECGLRRAYSTLEHLLADPEVDAVYISTRNELHAAQAIASARAGKHVLCEKPLALSLADAREIQAECERAGVLLAVNHHLRVSAPLMRMHELIAAGTIGDVVALRIFHARSLLPELRTWRIDRDQPGGGVILDITVHDADLARYLLDDEVQEVTAVSSSGELGDGGAVDDSVMGVMRMRRGTLVSFHDSFVVPHAPTGVEVHGSEGSLIATDALLPDPTGRLQIQRGDERATVEIPDRAPIYELVVERFMHAIDGDGTVVAGGDDGIRSLAVAAAAVESAATGRSVAPSA